MSLQPDQPPEPERTQTEDVPDAALLSTMHSSGQTHNTAPTRFASVDGSRFDLRPRDH
jgi:hypothetical protein